MRARPSFGNTELSKLSMPGSLDAATYDLDPQSFDTHAGSACSDFTQSMVPHGPLVHDWYTAQTATLQQQLDQGSRFVELDVGFNGVDTPTLAWRIDNTLFSEQPLQDYLIDIATWARAHPTEIVVVDLRTICVNGATQSITKALWDQVASSTSLFPSEVGGTPVSLASMMYDASATPLGTLTIDDVVHSRHNVVLLVPSDAPGRRDLRRTLHGEPYFVGSGPGDTQVAFDDTAVAPASTAGYGAANRSIEVGAPPGAPGLGSLAGKGLYVSPIAYDLRSTPATSPARAHLYSTFGGLITGAPPTPAWESGLLPGLPGAQGAPNAVSIAAAWGNRANVVAVDGFELSAIAPIVIRLNAG